MIPPGLPVFSTDLFLPTYRPMRSGDWKLRLADMTLCPSYWGESKLAVGMAALMRGSETWMSLTPLELESQEIGVLLARGHTAIIGMGMGWSAAVTALRDEVSAVTVVERDDDVLALHRELDVFSQLPPAAQAKIRIVQADAFEWKPDVPVDLLMPDIWLRLMSDGRVEEVRRMQSNVRAKEIYFWGQELEIARHARAAGRGFDAEGIAATVADFGLPLIGLEFPGYPELLAAAAARHMHDRWFKT